MTRSTRRREFLKGILAGGTGTLLWGASLPRAAGAEPKDGVCVTICNHWSYIGIGWQLGIESCVLSVTDAMEMADRPPHAGPRHVRKHNAEWIATARREMAAP